MTCSRILSGQFMGDFSVNFFKSVESPPRTDKCHWLDKAGGSVWRQDFKLPAPRAFAASVVLPDGRLWILGGLADPDEREGDDNDIFASTVIVESIPHRYVRSC